MQRRWTIGPVTVVALALGLLLPPTDVAHAQSKNSERPAPPASAKPGPYKPVAITLPERLADPTFEAFRKTLAGVAQRKDKAALTKLIHKGFFWQREKGNGADPKKSPMANFSAAMGLDNREDPDGGWEAIAVYAEDPTAFSLTDRKGVICGPADPGFEEDALQTLTDATKSDIGDWVYPLKAGVELRGAARADAPVTDKVGLTFVRVIGSDGPEDTSPGAGEFLNVMLPSGKSGFVKVEDVASLSVSQLCYTKDGGNWMIAGVLGGAE